VTCSHDGCAELATVRYYWPGQGFRLACAPHGAVAVTEGRSLGWRITLHTWPEPEHEHEPER
jgi:hypothetical protein